MVKYSKFLLTFLCTKQKWNIFNASACFLSLYGGACKDFNGLTVVIEHLYCRGVFKLIRITSFSFLTLFWRSIFGYSCKKSLIYLGGNGVITQMPVWGLTAQLMMYPYCFLIVVMGNNVNITNNNFLSISHWLLFFLF